MTILGNSRFLRVAASSNKALQSKEEMRKGDLWVLVYATLKPKAMDSTPNACLNRLVRERISGGIPAEVNERTATIRRKFWAIEELRTLERKHDRVNDENDNRPLVVVKYGDRKLLIDGNHRVNRWLTTRSDGQREVLLIEV